MRFPLIEQIGLPVVFEQFVPGQPHRDGRRYLPQLIFRLTSGLRLVVVDRHHYVNPEDAGLAGSARLVLLLGRIFVQPPGERRQGIVALPDERGPIVASPAAYGRIVALPAWEVEREHLPYQQLFTELLLDVGDGVVGVRTSMTAGDLAAHVGSAQLQVGDWIGMARAPRIDVLAFTPSAQPTIA